MNILFLSDVPLENPSSGAEQMLNKQATLLAESGGESVYAITRKVGNASWDIKITDNIREGLYYADPDKAVLFFRSLFKYPKKIYQKFIKDTSFQVGICHQPFTFFALLITGKLRNVPCLYNFHSPSHMEYLLSNEGNSFARTCLPAIIRRYIEKICLKHAAKIMAESLYMKQKVEQIHKISNKKIVVNPGGVDLERFKPEQERNFLKRKLNLPENKIHILTVRNLDPRMGIDNLIKSMSYLKIKRIGLHLTIGGSGIEKKYFEDIIKDYDLQKDVTMTGFIPSDLLPQYYNAADFFIIPTRRLEGFGLVTPESMACGTPVLGTPVGATKEILSGFDSEFLFKSATPEAMADGIALAVNKYFFDENIYNDLRRKCRKYAEANYSWQRHIDQLKTIIDEIITVRTINIKVK